MRAVSVSLERAQSVELARVLQRWIPEVDVLGRWIEEGRNDPLPEVRFAAIGQSDD